MVYYGKFRIENYLLLYWLVDFLMFCVVELYKCEDGCVIVLVELFD